MNKNNRVLEVIAVLLMIVFVSACGSDVDLVKDGMLESNQTLTIGEAFGGWAECHDGRWSEIKGERGERYVQYVCRSRNVLAYLKQTEEKVRSAWPESDVSHLRIKNLLYKFQWAINKNSSFALVYSGVHCEWADGHVGEYPYNSVAIINDVYANAVYFHADEQEIWQGIASPQFLYNAYTRTR